MECNFVKGYHQFNGLVLSLKKVFFTKHEIKEDMNEKDKRINKCSIVMKIRSCLENCTRNTA